MIGLAVLAFVAAAALAVMGSVDQRRLYWGLQAWAHRRPEANEPSDAGYTVQRATIWFVAAVMVVIGFMIISAHQASVADEYDVEAGAQHAASVLRDPDNWWLSIPTRSDVESAVRELHPDLQVSGGGDDRYQVTNSRFEHPVCLTIEVTGYLDNQTVSTEVASGSC